MERRGARARASVDTAGFLAFGALALSSATGFFVRWGHRWIESEAWAALFLAGFGAEPTLAISLVWLVRHPCAARSEQADEKACRSRGYLAAFAL